MTTNKDIESKIFNSKNMTSDFLIRKCTVKDIEGVIDVNERELPEDDRCAFYLKDKKVEIEDGVDVNPLDTEQFDYDDIKRIFGEEIINNSGTS